MIHLDSKSCHLAKNRHSGIIFSWMIYSNLTLLAQQYYNINRKYSSSGRPAGAPKLKQFLIVMIKFFRKTQKCIFIFGYFVLVFMFRPLLIYFPASFIWCRSKPVSWLCGLSRVYSLVTGMSWRSAFIKTSKCTKIINFDFI